MGPLVGLLISGTHRRLYRLAMGLVMFVLLLGGATWIVSEQLAQNMRAQLDRNLVVYGSLRANIVSVFDAMETQLTMAPCSPAYLEEMRRIAFMPFGISELLYAPGGIVFCASDSGWLKEPLHLGAPDVAPSDRFGIALWLDRPIDAVGLGGLSGTIARRGAFGIIIPPQFMPATDRSDWMEEEMIYNVGESGWITRSGIEGIYGAALTAPQFAPLAMTQGVLYQYACDPADEHCVAGRVAIFPWLLQRITAVLAIVLVLGVLATWLTQQICSVLERYWSFESRFLRRLGKGSVVCVYQPLLDLSSNTITGCEVLARWRDVDGSLVSPDRFLPIIEKHKLTERFTNMVVACAYAELSPLWTDAQRLQVNVNIFPQDLDAEKLIPIFAPFLAPGLPFDMVVELVETAEIQPETAQREIEKLREVGIGTYVDDFGAGYSSMHTLAALSIDGVKLDRSFAMASDDSVMARMLDHAIDLVHESGRKLVVEGVETQERLNALRACNRVDLAQGYGIARPMAAPAFIALLRENRMGADGISLLVA